jgi:hypothetical protein
MIDNTPTVSLTPYLLQFAGIYVLISILVMAFFYFTEIDPPSVTGMLSVMAGAMIAGQNYATKTRRLMGRKERLTFASLASLIAVVGSIALLVVFLLFMGVPFSFTAMTTTMGLPDIPVSIWFLLLALSLVLSWVVAYFTVNLTAKTYLKKLNQN